MWYNSIIVAILRSPLHAMLGSTFLLITYTGRKSGKQYTVPTNFVREDDVLYVTSRRERTWWRNMLDGAPVKVRMQGRDYAATASAIADDTGVAAKLPMYLSHVPGLVKYYDVAVDADGTFEAESIARAAHVRVLVEIRLNGNTSTAF